MKKPTQRISIYPQSKTNLLGRAKTYFQEDWLFIGDNNYLELNKINKLKFVTLFDIYDIYDSIVLHCNISSTRGVIDTEIITVSKARVINNYGNHFNLVRFFLFTTLKSHLMF